MITANTYEWVVEGDITACFDEIAHPALMDRVRNRIGDKCVVELVKAFLKAVILSQDGSMRHGDSGTPQVGSFRHCWQTSRCPFLDEHVAQHPGGPNVTHRCPTVEVRP